MIKRKATGDLESFAKKNNLCKSAMAGVIQEMKELGFPIQFDRNRCTYYYSANGQMVHDLFEIDSKSVSIKESTMMESPKELCFSEIMTFKLCNDE
ncbi:hypothetical protein [Terrimonas sp.]|uniref:hypothetical protein n=1 Tax=Terrimonas sp. TaxID=1914338 RepID=UPI000E32A421|nr:hypothetical protein [Terrimonas sp.]